MNDDVKKLILARRARFVLAAVAAAGVTASACGGSEATQSSDAGADAAQDATPQPCLTAPQPDAGVRDGAADADAQPQPCLAPPLPDSGADADEGGG